MIRHPLQIEKLPNPQPTEYRYTGVGNIYNIYDDKLRDKQFINENLPDGCLNIYPRFSVLQEYYKLYKNKAFQSHMHINRMTTNQEDLSKLLMPNPSMDYLMNEFHKMKSQPENQEKYNKATLTDVESIIQQAQEEIDYQIQKQNTNITGNVIRNPYTNQYIPRSYRENINIYHEEKLQQDYARPNQQSQLSIIQNQLKIIEKKLKFRPNEQVINQMIEQTIMTNKVFCSLLVNGNITAQPTIQMPPTNQINYQQLNQDILQSIQLLQQQQIQQQQQLQQQQIQQQLQQQQQKQQQTQEQQQEVVQTISPPIQTDTVIQQVKQPSKAVEPLQVKNEEENETTVYVNHYEEEKQQQGSFLTELVVHHPPTIEEDEPNVEHSKDKSPIGSKSSQKYQITEEQYKHYDELSSSYGQKQNPQREEVLAEKSMIDDSVAIADNVTQDNNKSQEDTNIQEGQKQEQNVIDNMIENQNVSSLFSKTGISLGEQKSPHNTSNNVPITNKQLYESLNSSISMEYSNLRHLQSYKKQKEEEIKIENPKIEISSKSIDIDDESINSADSTPKVEEKKQAQPQKAHKKRKSSKVPQKAPEPVVQKPAIRKKQKKKQPIIEYKDDSTLSLDISIGAKRGTSSKKQGIIQWDDSDDSDF